MMSRLSGFSRPMVAEPQKARAKIKKNGAPVETGKE
jgi:hypothetical protein